MYYAIGAGAGQGDV